MVPELPHLVATGATNISADVANQYLVSLGLYHLDP